MPKPAPGWTAAEALPATPCAGGACEVAAPLLPLLEADGRWPVGSLLVRPDAWILEIAPDSAASWVLQVVPRFGSLPPFGLRIAPDRLVGEPGAVITVADGSLTCGDLRVDLRRAKVRSAQPDWERLRRRLAESPPSAAGGHGRASSRGPEWARPPAELLVGLERLAGAREIGDRPGMLAAVRFLAGRGPGLTPAGDDVLLGAILALHVAGDDPVLAGAWAAEAGPRTTRLSRAWLEAAARGEVGEVWGRFLDSLLGDGPDPPVARRELLAWGATSGACSLAGFERLTGGA